MAKQQVVKATLGTGKKVLLKLMKISDTEKAAEMVAQRANGDQLLFQTFMQKALLQLLIVAIDDKPLSAQEKESIGDSLSIGEYSQLLRVVAKMSGADDTKNEPTLEFLEQGE